jgi:hypothetical protein
MNITFTKFKRWGIALTLAANCLPGVTARAQLAANTYQFSALSGTFTEITGTAITGISVDDGTSAALPIGFTFNYCGTDYTQVKVCSNGWVTFNTAVTTTTWTNDLTNVGNIKPALMPLFDDLAGWGTGAAPSYTTTGTAPNRIFTIQLKNWNWRMSSGSAPNLAIQVKLYETTNVIEYIYRQETAVGDGTSYGATIGIADNNATVGYLVLNNSTASPTVSSTTLTTNITARPATGQIYRFKPMPPFDMDADSIVVATPFCSNASQPVSARIKNLGTATINTVDVYWSVDGVAQPPVTYSTAPISNFATAPNNTAIVPLGSVFYPNATPRVIKAWTYQPNGMPDEVPLNDTVSQGITAGLAGVEVHIAPKDTTICQGTSVMLDAGSFPNNPIYIWSTGSLSQTIDVAQPGTYFVKVQNDMGCYDRDTVTIAVHPNPLVNSIAIIDNGGNTFTFNAIGAQNIDNWSWDFDDGTAPVTGTGLPIPQQIHNYTAPGEYTVTLTLSNDCNEITTTRLIKIEETTTGIDNLSALQKELKLYPNPAQSLVTVSSYTSALKLKSVAVYNLMGQQVYESAVKADKHQLDVSSMAAGIYNVIITTDKGKATKKLEVIK